MKNGLADVSWGRITENIGPENTEFPLKYKTLAESSKISVNSQFLARILSSPSVVSFPRAFTWQSLLLRMGTCDGFVLTSNAIFC